MVIPQIIKSLDSNLESHSTNLWLGNVSPQTVAVGSIKWQEYHMAQSANKERAILEIEPFWAKPTLEPPLQWNRWQIMLKLAIMAKEGISIDILLALVAQLLKQTKLVIPQISKSLDSNLESHSTNFKRICGSDTYLHRQEYHRRQSRLRMLILIMLTVF